MRLPRVGGGDDHADRFLIKALETTVALKVLKVTADRPLSCKTVMLFGRDPSRG
jgi:hypothetical protein